ncbi:MAG: hypothetical protein P9M13_03880 [Candidatus Ancaeobacter aquaticus]|nr:hypothetical protein [Candidatus Ancaeobacter aquaticus]
MKYKEKINGKDGCYWIEDGIVRHNVAVKEYTLEMAKEVVKFCKKLNKGSKQKCLLLVDMGNVTDQTPESTKYMSSDPEIKKVFQKVALMVKNIFVKMAGECYLKLANPIVPTKLFTDEAGAIKWLKSNK